MILYDSRDVVVALPMPLLLVVEDVGWWQGEDGSGRNQPYRNGFCRRHCLADYHALVSLSGMLSMRIVIAMVLGEWDRSNLLREVVGATWMGTAWDNRANQGPWLDEAADYLLGHQRQLEIAVHGLCHEFWQDGRMQRSEFHDDGGRMRPREIVASHLEAFGAILRANGFMDFPRLFVPPALRHSFGNGEDSIQALLKGFGIDYVTTRFARARQYTPPVHEMLTWESGVAILERGVSPVSWRDMATTPGELPATPVVALHWGNLLHADPQRNGEIVDRWAEKILNATTGIERIAAADAADCWRQTAALYLADIRSDAASIFINLRQLPPLPSLRGPFSLKVLGAHPQRWRYYGAEAIVGSMDRNRISIVTLHPLPGALDIRIDTI
ncbi:MAG: hypothetical protein F9K32_01060 [Desulfobulbaceae bacterium]|nr:MAG: hypothetical protein F9K32_01060 [Desulfobulbaceae bacterium]